jgi:FkbM family methyltransferase
MILLEYIRLILRARKYRYRNDPGEISYLFSKIKAGDIVFDIGAHKGAYLYYMCRLAGKEGKVYAFEPQSVLYKYLCSIKTLFATEPVIENLALSEKNQEMTLLIPAHKTNNLSSPGASLNNRFEGQKIVNKELIQCTSLDFYCQSKNIYPIFLKIDVEGHELEVLKGAVNILKAYRPTILIEIEQRHIGIKKLYETFDFLLSMGYEGYFFYGKIRTSLNEFKPDIHQNIGTKPYCNNFVFE